ncbi:MAG TPA: hypothetical protein VNS32_27345 [Flavisolibacter sp.]|nr:hypothetical protein [Flavisolibacter sp.]
MKTRVLAIFATVMSICAVSFSTAKANATPTFAHERVQQTNLLQIPVLLNGVTSTVLTITQFAVQNGQLVALGTIPGVSGLVTVPLQITQGTCQILTLHVGAIHLDLLGLVIDIAPIDLNITAQSAPGNLLGNLLCAVAHLLDNPTSSLSGISALLNRILALL